MFVIPEVDVVISVLVLFVAVVPAVELVALDVSEEGFVVVVLVVVELVVLPVVVSAAVVELVMEEFIMIELVSVNVLVAKKA